MAYKCALCWLAFQVLVVIGPALGSVGMVASVFWLDTKVKLSKHKAKQHSK